MIEIIFDYPAELRIYLPEAPDLAGSGPSCADSASRSRARRHQYDDQMATASVNGITIGHDHRGDRPGTRLVLIRGHPFNRSTRTPQVDAAGRRAHGGRTSLSRSGPARLRREQRAARRHVAERLRQRRCRADGTSRPGPGRHRRAVDGRPDHDGAPSPVPRTAPGCCSPTPSPLLGGRHRPRWCPAAAPIRIAG